jgi:branched-chain amino acid transport system permease protein
MEILSQLILNSIIAGAMYALMALGFNLIYSCTRFFNLAHGVAAAAGGYAVFYLTSALGQNVYLAMAAGIVSAGALGYGFDKLVFLRLRRKKTSSMVQLVASLGLLTSVQAVIAILFTNEFQTFPAGHTLYTVLGGAITGTQTAVVASGFLITILLAVVLRSTMFGKAVNAISDDAEVARIVGIDTDKITGRVFFIGSAVAGVAGILTGFDTGLEPTMGMGLLLKGVIACIIGGMGNVWGGAAGSLLLGFAENFGIWKIPGQWKDAISFVILIAFLLLRPEGIIKK